jgi:YVTN family beta-propeller protein
MLISLVISMHQSGFPLVHAISSSDVTSIAVGYRPTGIAYNPENGNMYVVNSGSNSVSVIDSDTNRVISEIPVGRNLKVLHMMVLLCM